MTGKSNARKTLWIFLLTLVSFSAASPQQPGTRTVVDAHNCYPYGEWWYDRIDRALDTGLPVAIEQDLNWYRPKNGGIGRSVLGHGGDLNGHEPGMEQYFFERVRPIVEAALKNPDHSAWPLITLNLDFKTEEPEHLKAVWELLAKHKDWLTTADKTSDPAKPQPLKFGPILVLNGPSEAQEKVFYDDVPVGAQLLTFGAVRTNMRDIKAAPEQMESEPVSNYRRWWNNPWSVVEPEGQAKTGAWTDYANQRLRSLVNHAHQQGLWIRFYTLDGVSEQERNARGIFRSYNFPSPQAARLRWKAAMDAGVDYLATDEYAGLREVLSQQQEMHRSQKH